MVKRKKSNNEKALIEAIGRLKELQSHDLKDNVFYTQTLTDGLHGLHEKLYQELQNKYQPAVDKQSIKKQQNTKRSETNERTAQILTNSTGQNRT